ncbi:MAG: site-2 protease family protein [Clostridia bacterium]|nr:site-2 protease family protein [Clostridia bacterium]
MIHIEGVLLTIIGILLFELIIFLHELGHFLTAKKFGVKVNEFALGMGPKIIKFQKGETLYSLRLFPIGGFCSMEGEDGESEDERSFGRKKVWQRMIIVVAGAVMNIVLGFLLMMITLIPVKLFATNTIAGFAKVNESSQYLQVGDEIKSINGYDIYTSMDMNFALATAKSNDLTFKIERDGQIMTFEHVQFPTTKNKDGQEVIHRDIIILGVENNFGTLMQQTFLQTCSTVRMVWASLIGLITGQFGINEMAGPIGMTSAVSQAAAEGLKTSFWDGLNNLIFIMMVITVNLGVVNLLPLPALDGGRLVFLIIEAIRRKPVKPEHEGWVHLIGMVLLLLFMALISVNDIIRLFNH